MSNKNRRDAFDIRPFQPGDPSRFVFPSSWGDALRRASPMGVGTVCEVEVPGRLHASVLDMNRFDVGKPGGGGIGFAVAIYSRVRIEVTQGLGVNSRGNRAAVGSHHAELFQAMTGVNIGMLIEIEDHGYQHMGLGSSISIITALSVALNEIFGRPLSLRSLRKCIAYNYCEEVGGEEGLLGSGFETNVGAMVGIHGGMVVGADGCELIQRIGLPERMKILLTMPEVAPTVSWGGNEAAALLTVARKYDQSAAEHKAYRVFMDLLPAMKRGDLAAAGQVIYELAHIGSKKAECGLHGNAGEEIYAVIDELRALGSEIVCMSSVGPVVFAMSDREEVWERWGQWRRFAPDGEKRIFFVDNVGVRMRLDGVPVNYNREPWWD